MAAQAVVGAACGSAGLLADALHSASDLVSDGVTLVAVRMGGQEADEAHPFGYGKYESVAALAIGALVLVGTLGIAQHAALALASALGAVLPQWALWALGGGGASGALAGAHAHGIGLAHTHVVVASAPALTVAAVSIVAKEVLYRVTAAVGRSLGSPVLMANAVHHRSDAFTSVLALVGLAAHTLGLEFADPVCGLLIAALLWSMGWSIMIAAFGDLVDRAPDAAVRAAVVEAAANAAGVATVRRARCRGVGGKVAAELRVTLSGGKHATAAEYAAAATAVRAAVTTAVPRCSDVVVEVVLGEEADQVGDAHDHSHAHNHTHNHTPKHSHAH